METPAPISPEDVRRRMRDEWNARAVEDANFYVAFGRRDQDAEEFFASASDVIRSLKDELKRLPANANRRAWRALEIGCGPGRLMRPLSQIFGEIHGIDVSDEMIGRARENLRGIVHAHVHASSGADLAQFADDSFDFVYSYAVFQHIPSRDVVMNYLWEARRVLKPGGVLRVQINGLPETAQRYDTWSGVRISAAEIAEFARMSGLQLLALEGIQTQYMWTTMMKPVAKLWDVAEAGSTSICRITNTNSSEPVTPVRGAYAAITLWMENLPPACDLNNVRVEIEGKPGRVAYIGPLTPDGLQQLNVYVPEGCGTGLLPVDLYIGAKKACPTAYVRAILAPPQVPALKAVTDGIDQLSGTVIVTGTIKVTFEDVTKPDTFRATVGGKPVEVTDIFCTDPLPPRYEINLRLPEGLPKGPAALVMEVQRHKLASVHVEIR